MIRLEENIPLLLYFLLLISPIIVVDGDVVVYRKRDLGFVVYNPGLSHLNT